jgi:hypothetical protein
MGQHAYWTVPSDVEGIKRAPLPTGSATTLVGDGIQPRRSNYALAFAGGNLYFSQNSNEINFSTTGIRRIQFDAMGAIVSDDMLSAFLPDEDQSFGIAATSDHVYYSTRDLSNTAGGKIVRLTLSDSTRFELPVGPINPTAIALDPIAGHIYWADNSADTISRANLDGTSIQVIATGLVNPIGMAIEPARGRLYWSDSGFDDIRQVQVDASGAVAPPVIVTTSLSPQAIAIDGCSRSLYWADSSTGIHSIAVDDNGAAGSAVLVQGDFGAFGVALELPTATCDDGLACTTTDTCVETVCYGSPIDCSVFDGPCQVGVCSEPAGTCAAALGADGSACDDANACTTGEACLAGACQNGTTTTCPDNGDPCSDLVCNAGSGACSTTVAVADGQPCDDGNDCTTTDVCAAGVCAGGPMVTCPDNANPCTDLVCNASNGLCDVTAPVNDGGSCDDGDACTSGDVCAAGRCTAGPPITCPDNGDACTDNVCNAASGLCDMTVTVADGAICDDDDACTASGACSSGVCVGATPVVCDDSDDCTEDSCDPQSGCVHVPLDPVGGINALIFQVMSLNLSKGIANSLDAKLSSALAALDDMNTNNDDAALNKLNAFVNHVQAQTDGAISASEAQSLIASASTIIDALEGCP